jgi:Coenzyme PQQ synthesis protein D (PqqD)
MSIPPHVASRIQLHDDVLFQDLNGEAVLLNLKTGVYFGLDAVGSRVWRLLETHHVVSEVLDALIAEFDVARERCLEDLLALIANMEEHDLISLQR